MDRSDLMKLPAYVKFQELLEQLFQFDLADLDFGLYRVLRSRREAIQKYLAEELPKKLAKELEILETTSREDLLRRLDEVRNQIRRLAPNALDDQGNLTAAAEAAVQLGGELTRWIEQYKELQEAEKNLKLAEAQVNDVLLLIYDFLSRYYDEGDFIPVPRFSSEESYSLESYKDPTLALRPEDFPPPSFQGEEIFFHWPTRGMHYVKTDTFLKNYSFEIQTEGLESKRYRVRFVLDKVETVSDNNKATRFFFPKPENVRLDGDILLIPLDYRRKQEGDESNQQKVFEVVLPRLLEAIPDPTLRAALERPEGKKNEPLLFRRLKHFAALGSKDFFIHPHLKSFLERELDYFIKSQALRAVHLFVSPTSLYYRTKILEAFRKVTLDIISFLDQLEQVQARLFEKKRLVYRADYIVPIRFVPRELWPEILENEVQLQAWREDMKLEEPVTEITLHTHPSLPLYTGHFDESFKHRLLQGLPFEDLDEATDGILIHAENYGALRTLEARYREAVKVIYIDPPYNTDDAPILYKNGYRHSTWLSLIEERLRLSNYVLAQDGILEVAIDDAEHANLQKLLDQAFPLAQRVTFVINHHPQGSPKNNVSRTHDYLEVIIPNKQDILRFPKENGATERPFMRTGTAKNNFREGRYRSFYAILVDSELNIVDVEEPPSLNESYPTEPTELGLTRVYPIDSSGNERVWRKSFESGKKMVRDGKLIARRANGGKIVIYEKALVNFEKPISNWTAAEYNAGPHGSTLLENILGKKLFSYPKSIYAVSDAILMASYDELEDCYVLDYFAGSGTTGHAVIALNRQDKGQRKFILVEMGDYFDTVLLRRIEKVMYTPEWQEGRPAEEPKVENFTNEAMLPVWMQYSPRLVKVLRLESYDDSLYNLSEAQGEREKAVLGFVKEKDYFVQYFSDVILDGNPTVMRPEPLEAWKEPESIRVKRPVPGAPGGFVEERVDWLETAALWLGVRPRRYREFVANGRVYRVLEGDLKGEKVALVLRNAKDLAPEEDRKALEENLKDIRVIVNAPLVAKFEALEDRLEAALWEGPK